MRRRSISGNDVAPAAAASKAISAHAAWLHGGKHHRSWRHVACWRRNMAYQRGGTWR